MGFAGEEQRKEDVVIRNECRFNEPKCLEYLSNEGESREILISYRLTTSE